MNAQPCTRERLEQLVNFQPAVDADERMIVVAIGGYFDQFFVEYHKLYLDFLFNKELDCLFGDEPFDLVVDLSCAGHIDIAGLKFLKTVKEKVMGDRGRIVLVVCSDHHRSVLSSILKTPGLDWNPAIFPNRTEAIDFLKNQRT